MITLSQVNAMDEAAYVQAFGDVVEHSPWVARGSIYARPFKTRDDMIAGFERTLRAAPPTAQLMLIRMHPDLASKARLTDDSSREQRGAGLTSLSANELERFTSLNTAYKQRFGFPFIFAVKGASKEQILQSFVQRLGHSTEAELEIALQQVMRIFRFRLEDRVAP
jgi:2-oxo-4-hydroxy-4-carboxy-5-ureidoimidazoline decarboxylase